MNKISPILENSLHKIEPKIKSLKQVVQESSFEKQPQKDVFDFSMEECGKFRIGERIVRIIFPR